MVYDCPSLLALTPCGRSLSVDRWLAMRAAERRGEAPPPELGPLYGQRLLAMQVSAVSLFAVWDKLTPGFLSGARLQHILLDRYGTSSTPLDWREVEAGANIEDFRIDNVRARIVERGDLWKPLLAARGRADLDKFLSPARARRAARRRP